MYSCHYAVTICLTNSSVVIQSWRCLACLVSSGLFAVTIFHLQRYRHSAMSGQSVKYTVMSMLWNAVRTRHEHQLPSENSSRTPSPLWEPVTNTISPALADTQTAAIGLTAYWCRIMLYYPTSWETATYCCAIHIGTDETTFALTVTWRTTMCSIHRCTTVSRRYKAIQICHRSPNRSSGRW